MSHVAVSVIDATDRENYYEHDYSFKKWRRYTLKMRCPEPFIAQIYLDAQYFREDSAPSNAFVSALYAFCLYRS